MNQQTALKILIEAVRIANKNGAYTLEDSASIFQAVSFFTQPKVEKQVKKEKPMEETTQETVETPVEETVAESAE